LFFARLLLGISSGLFATLLNHRKELQQALLDVGEEEQDTQSLKDYGYMIILEVIFSNCSYYWFLLPIPTVFLWNFSFPTCHGAAIP
jgi:hypothetical protein